MARRSYPMSEVRGSGQECQAASAQEWPRVATPRPRSGAVAVRNYPMPEVRAVAKRSYPTPEVRGGCRGEQPHIQGAAAVWVQVGQEELLPT